EDDSVEESLAVTPEAVPALVRAQVAAVVGVEDPRAVERSRSFKELGFDSLAAVEFHRRMCTATGLRLPTSLTFDHPTPDAVIAYVRSQFGASAGEGEAVARMLTRLDGLRALLAREELDDTARDVVAARLNELLTLCARRGSTADETVEHLESASDSEMLDFISNELGIS
ncbi:phosphopantetheine-binding protein, partial [Streptomyces sp. NPDC058828]|uniref:acyl carrier protein n=1 Tax=unclassified Streptomyces TaxID=2593676 RepID=UPI003683F0DF